MLTDIQNNVPRKRGRPLKPREYNATIRQIQAYWEEIGETDGKKVIPTITRLAKHLQFCECEAMHNRASKDDDIGKLIKSAIRDISTYWEQRLDSPSATGAIFWLKNRGWKDIQEVKVNDDQQKAITDAQRQAAREFAEQMLLRKLPTGGDIVGGKAQTTIVANPGERNIGPSDISTEFTSDNNNVTKSHNDIPDPAGKWAMDDNDNSNVTMSSGDKGIDAFGALDPAKGEPWAMDDDDTAAVTA
jgi:hypothetical protein